MTVLATTPRRPVSHAFTTPVVREVERPRGAVATLSLVARARRSRRADERDAEQRRQQQLGDVGSVDSIWFSSSGSVAFAGAMSGASRGSAA